MRDETDRKPCGCSAATAPAEEYALYLDGDGDFWLGTNDGRLIMLAVPDGAVSDSTETVAASYGGFTKVYGP